MKKRAKLAAKGSEATVEKDEQPEMKDRGTGDMEERGDEEEDIEEEETEDVVRDGFVVFLYLALV